MFRGLVIAWWGYFERAGSLNCNQRGCSGGSDRQEFTDEGSQSEIRMGIQDDLNLPSGSRVSNLQHAVDPWSRAARLHSLEA